LKRLNALERLTFRRGTAVMYYERDLAGGPR
jgi:hypothetical protein